MDRTGTIGASDTHFVMMNWKTKTFQKWWAEKLGEIESDFSGNLYTICGTLLEEHVLKEVEKIKKVEIQKPEAIKKGVLVVHLDGFSGAIWEVKCQKFEKVFFEPLEKRYWQQIQVQMYAAEVKEAYAVRYAMMDYEYDFNYCLSPKIDQSRIVIEKVEYDEKFIKKYCEKLEVLAKCISEGSYPNE